MEVHTCCYLRDQVLLLHAWVHYTFCSSLAASLQKSLSSCLAAYLSPEPNTLPRLIACPSDASQTCWHHCVDHSLLASGGSMVLAADPSWQLMLPHSSAVTPRTLLPPPGTGLA